MLIADGDYDIEGNLDTESLIIGSGDRLAVGRKDTAWNFDGRGDAYVSVFTRRRPYRLLTHFCRIRNAFDIRPMIQLTSDRQNVSHL